MRPPLRVGTVYDFRNTPESGMDMPSLYAAIMDQVVMLDGLGLDLVWFTEHHFLDDGYLPSWVPMAGAIAARTKRVRLSSDVCLLPFNHPVRLAEDLAVLDNISNGRIEVGVGMGYAPHEFRGFGLPVSRRVSLTDEGIEVLRQCYRGEVQLPWQALRFRRRGNQAALRAAGWPPAVDCCDVGGRRTARGTQ
jgi:alkanesulfonate monooxygenase SsuD/methylene tetrahydromethanopterin reductase-like flavin-dependent oxidoreductase (luciferase family)